MFLENILGSIYTYQSRVRDVSEPCSIRGSKKYRFVYILYELVHTSPCPGTFLLFLGVAVVVTWSCLDTTQQEICGCKKNHQANEVASTALVKYICQGINLWAQHIAYYCSLMAYGVNAKRAFGLQLSNMTLFPYIRWYI